MRTRNHRINCWLNDREFAHLKQQVEQSGLSMEGLIRSLIMGIEVRPKPPEQYATLLQNLSAIGNNLNQIAHIANGQKYIRQTELNEVTNLVQEARTLFETHLKLRCVPAQNLRGRAATSWPARLSHRKAEGRSEVKGGRSPLVYP